MKKYVYNLNGNEKEYDLETICKHLKIDKEYLKEILDYSPKNINEAITKAYAEQTAQRNLEELTKLFNIADIEEYGIDKMSNIVEEIKHRKNVTLEIIEDMLASDETDYIFLTKEDLCLLLFNTLDKLNKKTITPVEQLYYYAIQFPHAFKKSKLTNRKNPIINNTLSQKEFELSSKEGTVLTKENGINLVNFTNSHKVPKTLNSQLFKTLKKQIDKDYRKVDTLELKKGLSKEDFLGMAFNTESGKDLFEYENIKNIDISSIRINQSALEKLHEVSNIYNNSTESIRMIETPRYVYRSPGPLKEKTYIKEMPKKLIYTYSHSYKRH